MSGLKLLDGHVDCCVSNTTRGSDMSIISRIKNTRGHGSKRGSRALARALVAAPTRSSREELLQLQNMGR